MPFRKGVGSNPTAVRLPVLLEARIETSDIKLGESSNAQGKQPEA